MIDRKQIADIRRLHVAEQWTVGTVAAELGLHHETVENALLDRPRPTVVRPSGLDPYVEFIRETLEKHPRLRATRVFQMLRGRGYTGSVRQLRRKVAELRPRGFMEAFLRRRTFAGEEAICGVPHRPSYAAAGNMRRPSKATASSAVTTLANAA